MTSRDPHVWLASLTKVAVLGVSLALTTALRWARLFPNNDPVLAVTLPCAKRGRGAAFVFPALAMVLFDVLSNRVGIWTLVTSATYGLLGLGFAAAYARLARRGRTVGPAAFVVSGVVGVLAFDFVTGPVFSSVLFRISFSQAFVGQIPFTLKHLASVSAYALILSPALDALLRQIERGGRAIERRLVASSRAG